MFNAIKYHRLKKQLTQRELGAKAGLNQADVSRFETGRAIPYPGQSRKLAEALGIDAGDLQKEA